jgi:hypothetical protein
VKFDSLISGIHSAASPILMLRICFRYVFQLLILWVSFGWIGLGSRDKIRDYPSVGDWPTQRTAREPTVEQNLGEQAGRTPWKRHQPILVDLPRRSAEEITLKP